MTGSGPTSSRPQDDALAGATAEAAPAPSPAIQRANRMSAANMVRSLLPLVVICLVLVGWQSLQQKADEGVRVVDPSSGFTPITTPTAIDHASRSGVAPMRSSCTTGPTTRRRIKFVSPSTIFEHSGSGTL